MRRPLPCQSGLSSIDPLVRPVFLADIHMGPGRPGMVLEFLRFLKTKAQDFRELFILGDIFEFWIGDDACWPALPVMRALRRHAAAGHPVYLMQGNRDVVLGEDFARRCGARLLRGPMAAEAHGRRIMLAHGDEWCLLDKDYQRLRSMLRDPQWQEKALGLSVPRRIAMALGARKKSAARKTLKTPEVMDVVLEAVAADARRLGCTAVIHGHTHRPAEHGEEDPPRYVIPNWEGGRRKQSGWVELDGDGTPKVVVQTG